MSDTPVPMRMEGVIYSDGGCRAQQPGQAASRGHAGWGLHGYFYTRETPKVGAGAKRGVPTVQGYDLNVGGKGEITVHQYIDGFGSIDGEATNNIAELTAACEAIKAATEANLSRLLLIGDSRYTLEGIEKGLPRWKANGWILASGQVLANVALWQELDHRIALFKASGGELETKWTKAHDGDKSDPGNVLADKYATRGVLALYQRSQLLELRITPAKGYWKPKHERSRMLSLAHWYFTTTGDMDTITKDGRAIYYTGDIRDSEEFLGKPISDATFSVVYLKEPEPMLTQLRQDFTTLSQGSMQGLIVGDLKTIFNRDTYDALVEYGAKLMVCNRNRQSIEHMDAGNLGHEIRPTRLAYTAVNVLESLEGVLNDYLYPKENTRVRVTDITHLLYERQTVKAKTTVKLLPTIATTTGSVDVPVTYVNRGTDATKIVCLTFGQDLPDRNTLSALALPDVKVVVVSWPESAKAFRFATIIECEGDIGIWSGPYANLQLMESD